MNKNAFTHKSNSSSTFQYTIYGILDLYMIYIFYKLHVKCCNFSYYLVHMRYKFTCNLYIVQYSIDIKLCYTGGDHLISKGAWFFKRKIFSSKIFYSPKTNINSLSGPYTYCKPTPQLSNDNPLNMINNINDKQH